MFLPSLGRAAGQALGSALTKRVAGAAAYHVSIRYSLVPAVEPTAADEAVLSAVVRGIATLEDRPLRLEGFQVCMCK